MKSISILLASTAYAAVARAHAGEGDNAIANALNQLDHKNDAHWTTGGEPRIDVVKSLSGDQSVNRASIEAARPGFKRVTEAASTPSADEAKTPDTDPMELARNDGWQVHPQTAGYHYKGQDVKSDAELGAMYGARGTQTTAQDISGQTGMGGATTARSPEPVEGELRKTHVELPSNGEPGEQPIGITQGVTGAGSNLIGTPEGTVENPARQIELSGEVAARSAGSVLTPTQAPAEGSNTPSISLGGAADPLVEAKTPGGAVIAEGAEPATFFEGPTAGGPFGHSGITASDGPSQAELDQMGRDFAGDPDEVETLQGELEEEAAVGEELRAKIDDLSAQLHTSLRTQAQIRRQIEANRPQSGNMTTIQTFLRQSQERRAAAARAAKK